MFNNLKIRISILQTLQKHCCRDSQAFAECPEFLMWFCWSAQLHC